jgi:hypothetical protein
LQGYESWRGCNKLQSVKRLTRDEQTSSFRKVLLSERKIKGNKRLFNEENLLQQMKNLVEWLKEKEKRICVLEARIYEAQPSIASKYSIV